MAEDSDRYQPRPLRAEITSAEYIDALDRLKALVEGDIDDIATVEQVAERMGTIGQDLANVVSATGKIEVRLNEDLAYVLRRDIDRGMVEVAVTDRHTNICKYDDKSAEIYYDEDGQFISDARGGFEIQLPSYKAIDPSDDNKWITHGLFNRGSREPFFLLVNSNENPPDMPKKFASALQEAVKDILPSIPHSTSVPPAFFK